jgi:hypothetical protein
MAKMTFAANGGPANIHTNMARNKRFKDFFLTCVRIIYFQLRHMILLKWEVQIYNTLFTIGKGNRCLYGMMITFIPCMHLKIIYD